MSDAVAPLLQSAIALHRQGAVAEAATRYRDVLRQDPENADALYYLALIACQNGRFPEGIELARRSAAIAPQARTHDLIGRALAAIGQTQDALAAFDAASACDASFAAAHGNRANLLSELGRHEDALAAFERALALDPNAAEDWSNRGSTLQALGRNEDALDSYDRALALNPGMAEAHVNRGSVLKDLARAEEALAAFDRALAIIPRFAEAQAGRSVALGLLNRFDEAVASAEQARALQPHSPLVVFAHGMALKYRGRVTEARAALEQAAQLAPLDDGIAFALSLLQLLQGDFANGWPNFERRPGSRNSIDADIPRWRGETFHGRLVLTTEQGLGDAIQFARFIPALVEQGHRVSVLTAPALVSFMRGIAGVEAVATNMSELAEAGRSLRWAPLMSVPAIQQLDLSAIPTNVPYWWPDPARVEQWRTTLGSGGFTIGIAWQGNPQFTADRGRSLPLAAFAPLAAIDCVRLIALQKTPGYEQVDGVDFREKIETPIDPSDRSAESLLDTAALMKNLDLVVTSDTMLAHLAGALACPTFVALRQVPDWRWLLDRDDSPWYPTMRLFRQTAEGDWAGVFARIADAVRARKR